MANGCGCTLARAESCSVTGPLASRVFSASWCTSSATTAKPHPCPPALAASIVGYLGQAGGELVHARCHACRCIRLPGAALVELLGYPTQATGYRG